MPSEAPPPAARRCPVGPSIAAEDGFTLVETLIASVILIVLLVGVASVMTASVAAHTISRERTAAAECAAAAIELVRRYPSYKDDVGTNPGNPTGKLPSSMPCGTNTGMTARIDVHLVSDPTPTSYSGNNYKRVTIRVLRDRDAKQVSYVVTYVSPSGRPTCPSCGATLNVNVIDIGAQQPYVGATVNLANGPTANRTDTTDSSGSVSFGALDPNPATGAQAYYDLTVTGLANGYQTLAADTPPGSANPPASPAHVQLAPSQTAATTIRVFKAATIGLTLQNGAGAAYTSGATVTIDSSFTGSTYTIPIASGSSGTTVTTLGGQPVIPGATYTVRGTTTSGLCAAPSPSPVPESGYPATTSYTFVLALTPCPTSTLQINAKQLGTNASGATVNVTGGPNGMSFGPLTTDSSGNVTVDVPQGSGYTVTAAKLGQTVGATVTASGSSTSLPLTIPDPPTGSLLVTATWGSALASCTNCVTLTGGPGSVSLTGSTDATGKVTFSGLLAGSGYTLTATKSGVSGTATASVTSGATTPASVALPTGTLNASVKWGGSLAASGATLSISGGPNAVNLTGLAANAAGAYTATLPAGSSTTYTITATKAGQSTTSTFMLPSGGSTATGTLNLPVGTLNATVRWGAAGVFSNGATVTITGGPEGTTITGTTNGSGVYSNTLMPAGTGTYTITATKGGASASTTFTIGSSGATATVSLALPVRTVVFSVQTSGGASVGTGATVTFAGGPEGLTLATYTTDSNGQVTITNVPVGTTTYTVKAWKTGCSGTRSKSFTNTALTVTSGTGSQAVTLKYNASVCPA